LVITSSTTAIKCVIKNPKVLYTNKDYSDLDYPSLYPRCKVNAETQGLKLAKELNVNTTIVNPSIVCGKFINSSETKTMQMFLPFFNNCMYLKTYLAFVHV